MDQVETALRPIEVGDWEPVHSFACLPEASRYQTWGPNSEEQTQVFVRAAAHAWTHTPQSRFVYAASVAGKLVGLGELNIRSSAQRQGEISYLVHPDVWGRGVGTAIGRSLLQNGFESLRLHRIYATCDPRNLASGRVLGKLGMTYEGRLRHTAWIRDGWRDSELFSILEDEWSAAQK